MQVFRKHCIWHNLSCLMTKPTKWHVRPVKTQISLGIRPVWSEYSLCAQWVAKDPSFLHVDSEDSDQTGRMPRLIWVFAGHTFCWFCHEVAHLQNFKKRREVTSTGKTYVYIYKTFSFNSLSKDTTINFLCQYGSHTNSLSELYFVAYQSYFLHSFIPIGSSYQPV